MNINVGVIVGRFQVDQLHEGHRSVLSHISDSHENMVIFIAIVPTSPTRRNPLDFISRRRMVEKEFPSAIVLPLADCKSDEEWSNNIDSIVKGIFPFSAPAIYGGRDNCLDSYSGSFQKCTYGDYVSGVSGTETRGIIARQVINSPEFRRGAIHSVYNRYPVTHFTVDMAVVSINKVLLGKKKGEKKYRFPGGFIDQGETVEEAARRELIEEVRLEVGSVGYICSLPIDDWRYKGSGDAVTTIFMECEYIFGGPEASDDLEEVDWFIIDKVDKSILCDSHVKLFEKLLERGKDGK